MMWIYHLLILDARMITFSLYSVFYSRSGDFWCKKVLFMFNNMFFSLAQFKKKQ